MLNVTVSVLNVTVSMLNVTVPMLNSCLMGKKENNLNGEGERRRRGRIQCDIVICVKKKPTHSVSW